MKLYQGLLACGLIGISSFLGSCTKKPKGPWTVYDSKLNKFKKRKKGINESVLNSLAGLEYKTKEAIKYYQEIENQEQNLEFSSIWQRIDSDIFSTVTENLVWIKAVDKTANVKEKYEPLKELLTKCNKVYGETEENSLERVINLHDVISEYIKTGSYTKGTVSIVDLVNGRIGNCDDVFSAYFALLSHYYIDCDIVLGEVREKGRWFTCLGYHGWLYIKTKDSCFELDPTWYNDFFAPLDTRKK